MIVVGNVVLDHLVHLSDDRGLFEHADGATPRREHGYCVDDNARLLIVTSREPDGGDGHRLSRLALDLVIAAQAPDGRCRNRLDITGTWTDRTSTDDCWGRALWGLGVAAAEHGDPDVRARALAAFEHSAVQRSPWSRAMAFAGLGAAAVLDQQPKHYLAGRLLDDALGHLGTPLAGGWEWPERRLSYANAAVAEAVIAAGVHLGDDAIRDRGLHLLGWLLDVQTIDGHLSVVGADGRGPDDIGPQFDQQPIEVAALAEASWRAFRVTQDSRWSNAVSMAARWFDGANDIGQLMADPARGAGYDGLQHNRVNHNQGAESTLAYLSTMQCARACAATT
jgi:hypothetical protein